MASYNRVILMGNLTRDPEVRYTPNGTAVTDIGLAVNRTWFDKQTNQRQEDVTFLDVTLWARTAEVAGEYLSKGKPVLIEGRLKMDSWDDRETGQKRYKLKIIGEQMTMLPSGGAGGPRSDGGGGARGRQGGNSEGNASSADEYQGGGGAGGEDYGASNPADSFYDAPAADIPSDEVPF